MALFDLERYPELRNVWVALAPVSATDHGDAPSLADGSVVVDADVDVGALVARLANADLTALEIRFCSAPPMPTS